MSFICVRCQVCSSSWVDSYCLHPRHLSCCCCCCCCMCAVCVLYVCAVQVPTSATPSGAWQWCHCRHPAAAAMAAMAEQQQQQQAPQLMLVRQQLLAAAMAITPPTTAAAAAAAVMRVIMVGSCPFSCLSWRHLLSWHRAANQACLWSKCRWGEDVRGVWESVTASGRGGGDKVGVERVWVFWGVCGGGGEGGNLYMRDLSPSGQSCKGGGVGRGEGGRGRKEGGGY